MSKNTLGYIEYSVDSRDRSSGTTDNFTINLPSALKIHKMQLIEAEIPISYYNVTTLNQNISFSDAGGTYLATIPIGNYSAADLLTAVGNEMTTAAAGGSGLTYTATQSTVNFRTTISTTANFSLLWNTGNAANLRSVLGYENTDLTGAMTYTSQGIMNINGEHYVFIKSNIIKGSFHGTTTSNSNDTTVLAKVQIDKTFGSVTTHTFTDTYPVQVNISGFPTTMTINTTFYNDQAIDFNGQNLSFKFALYIL